MSKIIVLGLDGLSPELVEKWSDELPNLSKLQQDGVWADIRCTVPPTAAQAWTSVRSGRWKLIQAARKTKIDEGEKYAVFDMENDWQESVNLFHSQPETFERLNSLLAKQKADGRTIRHGQPSGPADGQ